MFNLANTHLEIAWTSVIKHLLHIYRILAQPFHVSQGIIMANVNHWTRRHGARQFTLNLQAESIWHWFP
jgi:hypothetical protein